MDETTLNTIVGIVGGIIGVISVIITVISMRAKKVVTISTKSKIYASPGGSFLIIQIIMGNIRLEANHICSVQNGQRQATLPSTHIKMAPALKRLQ